MSHDNPYAPPTAAVLDVHSTALVPTAPTPWFAVSVTKLLVMTLCTLTFYQIYWFYQQWVCVRRREGSDIVPAARAIFALFFCYSLFDKVRRGVQSPGSHLVSGGQDASAASPRLAAGPLAAGWIVTALLWRAPGSLGLLALAGVLFALPVQAAMNGQNEALAPGHERNARFSLWNWLVVVPGGLLLLLVLIGSLLPNA